MATHRSARVLRASQSTMKKTLLLSLIAANVPIVVAESCISLASSTQCSAFNSSSISTDSTLTGLFPFLAYVSDTASFDQYLAAYISGSFVEQRYEELLGCTTIDLDNTTDVYARYTTSVLCNSIIQNSIDACNLTSSESRPLCADTCAEYALSEQEIVSSSDLCGSNSSDSSINTQIRADFTNCALPADSLTGSCIEGVENEPDNCGYSSNLVGLCGYCASSSPNATDSCCVNSDADTRCENVTLPITTTISPLFPSSTSSSATGTSSAGNGSGHGLSGGQVAGIVIGSILGAAFLLGLIIWACVLMRRRRASQAGSVFNQPSPSRGNTAVPMSYADLPPPMPPVGRVARMSALEETSGSDPYSSPAGAGYHHSGSDGSMDTPPRHTGRSAAVAAGRLPKRDGSLSSASRLALADDPSSPLSDSNGEEFSSPEGVNSGQSEQLPFFKDYYSQDEIRPNDTVATLWAYQPRANDEFELERGDLIKVVGIWDDGWATGVKLTETAEEWDDRRKMQRDSGMSNGSNRPSPTPSGEIKAFPLVCVCLPQHWRRTIEGDSTDTASHDK